MKTQMWLDNAVSVFLLSPVNSFMLNANNTQVYMESVSNLINNHEYVQL